MTDGTMFVVLQTIVTDGTMFVVIQVITINGTMIFGIFVCTMITGFTGNGDKWASSPHENETIVSVEDDVAVNTRIVGIEVGELIMVIHFAKMITGITGDGDRIGHDKDRGASPIAVAVVINGPPTVSTKHGCS